MTGFFTVSALLGFAATFQLKKLQKVIDVRFQNENQHGLNTKTYANKFSFRLNQYFHMLALSTTFRFMIFTF